MQRDTMPRREELGTVYQVWTIIRGVQPFFPIYAYSLTMALAVHMRLPRHQRILREFAAENPRVYVSAFKLAYPSQFTRDMPEDLYTSVYDVLQNESARLSELQELTVSLPPQKLVVHRRTSYFNASAPPKMVEIARFEVNVAAVEAYFASDLAKLPLYERFETNLEKYATPVNFRLGKAQPQSASPGQPITTNPSEEPEVGLNYLENIPPELAFQVALNLESQDLARICTISTTLNGLFCSEDSGWFWAAKLKKDFPELPGYNPSVAKDVYFTKIQSLNLEAQFGSFKLYDSPRRLFNVLLFLTGVINQDGVHPYPLDLMVDELQQIGYDRLPQGLPIKTDSTGRTYPALDTRLENLTAQGRLVGSITLRTWKIMKRALDQYFPEDSSYRFVYSPEFFGDNTINTLRRKVYEKTFLTVADGHYWVDQSRINYGLAAIRFIVAARENNHDPVNRVLPFEAPHMEFQWPRAGDEGPIDEMGLRLQQAAQNFHIGVRPAEE
jgi:hypothetical protein